MATPSLLSSLLLFLFIILFVFSTPATSKKSTYIVHVSDSHKPEAFASTHDWYSSILLHSVSSPSNTSTKSMPELMYTYSHSATGFAAQITAGQAARLRRLPFVLSVVPDQIVELATTHSPGFLGLSDVSGTLWPNSNYGSDMIIGVVDTGIWPENPSFDDRGINDVPPNWKGVCEGGPDFPASYCNKKKKVIGARFFYAGYEAKYGTLNQIKSARDTKGHGSHCASIAAGHGVIDAGYYGYAVGEARGVAPLARIAVYKVFWNGIATDADVLTAIEQAIVDGVHILSLSLGSSPAREYSLDPVAIGSFRAVQKGVVVSAAAGNDGPQPFTVINVAPWILTVAASSIDRQFPAHVVLGNGTVITGSSLYDYRQLPGGSTESFMLLIGQDVGSSQCLAGLLDRSSVARKIVICEMGVTSAAEKSFAVQQAGGVGMIFVDRAENGEDLQASPFIIPAITVTHCDGKFIKSYVSSTPDTMASIIFRGTIIGPSPSAPRMAAFSSRGPNRITLGILKPDVTAPGLNILAAWTGAAGPSNFDVDARRVNYTIISGTSMACPHVSGLGALLRKVHPTWSPSAIKSAIMTTSHNLDNGGNNLIDLFTGLKSSPLVHGSGHIYPERAADPGLVYDLGTADYIAFLCSIEYDTIWIAQIVGQDPSTINCPPNPPSPGDLNYPSFSIIFKSIDDTVTYTRVVNNVGNPVNAVYRVSGSAPRNVRVDVSPDPLIFSANQQALSYTISFTSLGGFQIPPGGLEYFGSVEWTDGIHRVRSPIVAFWPYRGPQQDLLASA